MDSAFSNKEFGKQLGVTFPLLSDWKRNVTKAYGLYNDETSVGRRGTFVINTEGIIERVEVGNTAIDPTGAFQTCDLLQKKKAGRTEPKP
jgi:peroxiredoxin